MNKADPVKLSMMGLPVIRSLEELSDHTHISKYTIQQLSARADKYYRVFQLPKKAGGYRIIYQPSKKLKGLQGWILNFILNKVKVSSSCKGFERGTSIRDNVEPHRNANVILNLDIRNFFPSITGVMVFNIFRNLGYNNLISSLFTNLCTVNNGLPQGGPCSPKLANLAAWPLDIRIQGLVGPKGITYTRYADDLTFSGLHPQKVVKIISTIHSIVQDENLTINSAKTRIAGVSRAKRVTGLIIHDGKIGIGSKMYKRLRSKIYHLTKNENQDRIDLINEVQGWLSYLNSVDRFSHAKLVKYIKDLKKLHADTLISQIRLPAVLVAAKVETIVINP